MFLVCTIFHTTLAQDRDSVLQQIDNLKILYQKKDIQNAVRVSNQIHEILISNLPKTKADDKLQSTKLTPISEVLRDEAFGTTIWSLSIQHESKEYKAISHKDYSYALNNFLEYSPQSEYQQALRYKTEMKNSFKWFTVYCDNIAKFLPNSSKRPIPFRFADNNGKKCVILSDIASSSVYNTLRSTSTSRASTVLISCIIPKIRFFYQAFEQTDFEYFGFIIFYGSKDFSEKSDVLNLKAEMLALIIPKDKCLQFIDGLITESEFIGNCDVYLTDRDMMFDYKKIKPQIE